MICSNFKWSCYFVLGMLERNIWIIEALFKLIFKFCEWKRIKKICIKLEFLLFLYYIKNRIVYFQTCQYNHPFSVRTKNKRWFKWKKFSCLDKLEFNVSCGFVWVCLISVSQFFFIESNNSFVHFPGRNLSRFIFCTWKVQKVLCNFKAAKIDPACFAPSYFIF